MNNIDHHAMKIASELIELDYKRDEKWEQLISIVGYKADQIYRTLQNGFHSNEQKKQTASIHLKKGYNVDQILKLVHTAQQFQSTIYFYYNHSKISGKNILGLSSLMVTIQKEVEIILEVEGKDAESAIKQILEVMENF